MGGMFSAPPPPPPPPLPEPAEDPAVARRTLAGRRRRGRAGTIVTSDRGILRPSTGRRKSLLGE